MHKFYWNADRQEDGGGRLRDGRPRSQGGHHPPGQAGYRHQQVYLDSSELQSLGSLDPTLLPCNQNGLQFMTPQPYINSTSPYTNTTVIRNTGTVRVSVTSDNLAATGGPPYQEKPFPSGGSHKVLLKLR